ncbi:ABC transporter transmembrane domain-containing protein [Streptomyces sp. G44]|uniref:ABC transporter transmembrane domain-containing protein n=1 Tax=Streptomyces sp. G44 TaxID=2807632 RepID=UPI0034D73716
MTPDSEAPASEAPASGAPAEGRSTVRSLLRLWPYVRPVRTRLITAAVVAVIASCTGLLFPLVLKWMVDGPVADGDGAGVWLGALLLLLLGVTEALLFGLRRWLVARPLASVEASMRADLYRHLQRLPVAFHDRWASGQLLSRGTTDLMLLRMFLAFPLMFLLVNGATIVVGVVILLGQDFTLGLVLLAPVVPMVIVCAYYEGRYTAVARRAQDQVGDLTTVVEESVLGIRVIKGFGRHRSQARAFRELSHTLRGTELAKARILAATNAVIMALPEAAIGAALVLGTVRVADGDLSAGTLVAFLSTALALRWPVESIGFLLAMTQESATATERYFEVLDAEPEDGGPAVLGGGGSGSRVGGSAVPAGGSEARRGGAQTRGGGAEARTGSAEARGAGWNTRAGGPGTHGGDGSDTRIGSPAPRGRGGSDTRISNPETRGNDSSDTRIGSPAPRGRGGSDTRISNPETRDRGGSDTRISNPEIRGNDGSDTRISNPAARGNDGSNTRTSSPAPRGRGGSDKRISNPETRGNDGSDTRISNPKTRGNDGSNTRTSSPAARGAGGFEVAGDGGGEVGVTGLAASGGLRFHRVEFRYPDAPADAPPVLGGVDLHIRPGETMALVGATGSGKTTLTALVPRLHEVSGGRITLDGEDIAAMDRERLRTLVAVAFEEPTLFSATVGENVLMGAEGSATEAGLARALDVAQAGFAHALPQGTGTQVGEQGLSLSGGQRQRLALARAVVGRPRFLVLDDPLSALDVHTEALVEAALRRVLADTTALIVAHRPSTVQLADRVALLSGGRVTAVGTHQELLRENAEYAWLMSGTEATETTDADADAEETAR